MVNTGAITEWLRENNLTQRGLADRAELGIATVSRLLRGGGNVRLHTLAAVSRVTDIPLPELLNEESPCAF